MNDTVSVAIYGATGALGREVLSLLEERDVVPSTLSLFGSALSHGEELLVGSRVKTVRALPDKELPQVDVAFVLLPADVTNEVYLRIKGSASIVIAVSPGPEGYDGEVVVPSLNGAKTNPKASLLLSPTDAAVPLAVALSPLHQSAQIKAVVVTSLEPASGAGQRGMEALSNQTLSLYRKGEVGGGEGEEDEGSPFPHQLAFNAVPQVGSFGETGLSVAENQIQETLPRLLGAEFSVAATAVRVPWFSAHGFSVTLWTNNPLEAETARQLLEKAEGIEVVDGPSDGEYPMPFTAVGRDEVFVGRIRSNGGSNDSLSLWMCSDNLRLGGAVNLVDIYQWWLSGRHPSGAA